MGFRSEKERKRQQRSAIAINKRNPGKSGFVTGRGRGPAGPSGVGGRIFNPDTGKQITTNQAIERARLGQRNTFVSDPFPTSPPGSRLGTVQSGGRIATRQPSIITGGTPDERRSVQIAESALDQSGARRRAGESNFERFCEIKIIKGKRKRVCRDKKITKKKTKTKTKTKKKTKPALRGFFN